MKRLVFSCLVKKTISHAGNIYLGVEKMLKDLEKAHRRGNQTGLNPPRASFQAISMLLPVQGL